jgi:hypothetical protein
MGTRLRRRPTRVLGVAGHEMTMQSIERGIRRGGRGGRGDGYVDDMWRPLRRPAARKGGQGRRGQGGPVGGAEVRVRRREGQAAARDIRWRGGWVAALWWIGDLQGTDR